jgi:hypothetical protein
MNKTRRLSESAGTNDGGIDFKAFKVSEHNIQVACKIVKERFKADADVLGIKIEIPKIDAWAVVDADFEKMRLYCDEKVLKCGFPKAVAEEKELQRLEYGENFAIEHHLKWCNGFSHITWQDGRCDKITSAEIYIRASIYDKNPRKFYAIMEHEVTHCLFPDIIFAENELRMNDEND